MFRKKEQSLGDYLRADSGPTAETTPERSVDQIATERMQMIKAKATGFKRSHARLR